MQIPPQTDIYCKKCNKKHQSFTKDYIRSKAYYNGEKQEITLCLECEDAIKKNQLDITRQIEKLDLLNEKLKSINLKIKKAKDFNAHQYFLNEKKGIIDEILRCFKKYEYDYYLDYYSVMGYVDDFNAEIRELKKII